MVNSRMAEGYLSFFCCFFFGCHYDEAAENCPTRHNSVQASAHSIMFPFRELLWKAFLVVFDLTWSSCLINSLLAHGHGLVQPTPNTQTNCVSYDSVLLHHWQRLPQQSQQPRHNRNDKVSSPETKWLAFRSEVIWSLPTISWNPLFEDSTRRVSEGNKLWLKVQRFGPSLFRFRWDGGPWRAIFASKT